MTTVSTRHKLGAAGLLALVLATLVAIVIAYPLVLGNRWNDDIAYKQQHLQKLIRSRTQLQQIQQQASENTATPQDNLITAANPSLAAAQLQSTLKNMVEDSNGIVLRTQIIDSSSLEQELPFTPISLLMQMRGDINSLRQVLYDIHRHRPDLFVTRLQIDNRQFGHNNPAHNTAIILTAAITIHGFMADESN